MTRAISERARHLAGAGRLPEALDTAVAAADACDHPAERAPAGARGDLAAGMGDDTPPLVTAGGAPDLPLRRTPWGGAATDRRAATRAPRGAFVESRPRGVSPPPRRQPRATLERVEEGLADDPTDHHRSHSSVSEPRSGTGFVRSRRRPRRAPRKPSIAAAPAPPGGTPDLLAGLDAWRGSTVGTTASSTRSPRHGTRAHHRELEITNALAQGSSCIRRSNAPRRCATRESGGPPTPTTSVGAAAPHDSGLAGFFPRLEVRRYCGAERPRFGAALPTTKRCRRSLVPRAS